VAAAAPAKKKKEVAPAPVEEEWQTVEQPKKSGRKGPKAEGAEVAAQPVKLAEVDDSMLSAAAKAAKAVKDEENAPAKELKEETKKKEQPKPKPQPKKASQTPRPNQKKEREEKERREAFF